ncbi:MAG: phosphocholine cytidylyltransferase family protein, partial [Thermoplasmata archaeon]
MIGVILAAGIGSRLRPITSFKPKCLVRVAGKPILYYQLEALRISGISEVVIILGYESSKAKSFCNEYQRIHKMNIKLIFNTNYENTNNMYSLYLARDYLLNKDFLLMNGDVVFDNSIVADLINNQYPDLIAVDSSVYLEESKKISINSDGFIYNISKQIPAELATAVSIDVYKFSATSGKIFLDYVNYVIENEGNLKDWTEVAMQRLFQNVKLKMK